MRSSSLRLFAAVVASAPLAQSAAHEPPVGTGVAIAPSGHAVVRTTRGLLVGDVATHAFRLQCLELSGILPQESVSLLAADDGLVVGSVAGLLQFDVDGCGRNAVADFDGRPIADVAVDPGGRVWLATNGAGQVNDAYWSDDLETWHALGLDLEGVFFSSFRPMGDGFVTAGVRIEPPSGAVHFVRSYVDAANFIELPVPVGDSGFEVRVLDVDQADASTPPQALVLLDRYADASEPDELYLFDGAALVLLHEAFVVADARFGGQGDVWVAHAAGLDQIDVLSGAVNRHLRNRRAAGLVVWQQRVFVTGEYGHNGFALAELVDGEPVTVADFDALVGPVECAARPGVCDVDWVDYVEEISSGFDGEPVADAGPDADEDAADASDGDANVDADTGQPDARAVDDSGQAPDNGPYAEATRGHGCTAAPAGPATLAATAALFCLIARSRRRASAG